MNMYMGLQIIMILLLLVTLVYVAYTAFARWQGDMHFIAVPAGTAPSRRRAKSILPAGAVRFTLEETTRQELVMVGEIVLYNDGKQQGTVMDCLGRAYLPCEQYPDLNVRVRLTPSEAPRTDDYWEAVLVPAKTGLRTRVEVTITAANGHLTEAIAEFGKVDFDVIYQVLGRSDWYYDKTRLTLTGDDIRSEWLRKGVTLR